MFQRSGGACRRWRRHARSASGRPARRRGRWCRPTVFPARSVHDGAGRRAWWNPTGRPGEGPRIAASVPPAMPTTRSCDQLDQHRAGLHAARQGGAGPQCFRLDQFGHDGAGRRAVVESDGQAGRGTARIAGVGAPAMPTTRSWISFLGLSGWPAAKADRWLRTCRTAHAGVEAQQLLPGERRRRADAQRLAVQRQRAQARAARGVLPKRSGRGGRPGAAGRQAHASSGRRAPVPRSAPRRPPPTARRCPGRSARPATRRAARPAAAGPAPAPPASTAAGSTGRATAGRADGGGAARRKPGRSA